MPSWIWWLFYWVVAVGVSGFIGIPRGGYYFVSFIFGILVFVIFCVFALGFKVGGG